MVYSGSGDRAIIWLLVLLGCIAIAVRQARDLQRQHDLKTCKEYLRTIGIALEQSFVDHHGGFYPGQLEYLVPRYLKRLPVCPVSQQPYVYVANWTDPELCVVYCSGHHILNLSETCPPITAPRAWRSRGRFWTHRGATNLTPAERLTATIATPAAPITSRTSSAQPVVRTAIWEEPTSTATALTLQPRLQLPFQPVPVARRGRHVQRTDRVALLP